MLETRKVEQYKIYTLHENVVKVVGKKDGKEVTRTDRVPVAVFDDKKALEKYVKQTEVLSDGHKDWEAVEDWTETKPTAEATSLPFNPEPVKVQPKKDNGDN